MWRPGAGPAGNCQGESEICDLYLVRRQRGNAAHSWHEAPTRKGQGFLGFANQFQHYTRWPTRTEGAEDAIHAGICATRLADPNANPHANPETNFSSAPRA